MSDDYDAQKDGHDSYFEAIAAKKMRGDAGMASESNRHMSEANPPKLTTKQQGMKSAAVTRNAKRWEKIQMRLRARKLMEAAK